jgi:hypothetical protein
MRRVTQQESEEDERTHRYTLQKVLQNQVLLIVILILLGSAAICTYFVLSMTSAQQKAESMCPVEDPDCFDFDPCHVCTKRQVCSAWSGESDEGAFSPSGDDCGRQYTCDCRPVPNGTCCNQQDYCYLDDPNKRCVYGQCVSPNQTLCRGACPYTTGLFEPCDAVIPIIEFGGEYPGSETFCLLASCVTLFTVNGEWAACDAFLETVSGNFTNKQIASCAECETYTDPTAETTTCMCQWRCAPFGGFPFGKKRVAAAAAQTQNSTIYFRLSPSLSFSDYTQINQYLNSVVHNQVVQLKSM